MAKYKLKELCEFITDGTHQTPEYCGNDGVIFLSSKDVTERKINWDSVKYIPNALHEKLCKRLKPRKNDILLAKNGTTGVAAIVDRDEIFDVYVSLAVLRPLNVVYPKYLLYAINSPVVKRQFDAGLKGVGVPNLHLSVIKETWINVVKKEGQQKVCKVLDKIEKIIELKKQELQLLDELIKARFVEMFGDPVSNSCGLPEATLPELGEFGRGVSKHRPRNDPKLLDGEYPLIQTGDVANADLYILTYNSTYSELGLKQSKMWKKGTLCITIAANIAKTAILNFDACFPDSVVGFEANNRTNNIFIHYWFSFFQEILETQAPESAQKNINLKVLSELKVIVPGKKEQDKFTDFVNQVNKSKVAVQKSLDETQLLFDSLMQKYFG